MSNRLAKLAPPLVYKFAGLLSATAIRNWMSTLEFKVAHYDPTNDPAHPECRGQKIYLVWHEYVFTPMYLRGHANLAMLFSQHRDAEVLTHIAYHCGCSEHIRGSSYRGGMAAMRELIRTRRRMNISLTPDGPRGPRRTLAPGAIFLASKLGLPLVVLGIGYDRPWRLKTWDRFAVPRPASRAHMITGPVIPIPADLDRDGLEHYRASVERLMNRLSCEAEAWAESGTAKIGEMPMRREPPARQRIGKEPPLDFPRLAPADRLILPAA